MFLIENTVLCHRGGPSGTMVPVGWRLIHWKRMLKKNMGHPVLRDTGLSMAIAWLSNESRK